MTWGYAGVVLLVLAVSRWLGDLWWPATLLLLMPMALWLVPLALLAAANAWVRRWRLALGHLALALVIVGPLMGLKLPISRIVAARPEGVPLRVMTFNRGMDRFDPGRFLDLVRRERIDLICLQDPADQTEPAFQDPAVSGFFEDGWYHNSKWTIVSRFPIVEDMGQVVGPDPDLQKFTFRPGKIDRAVIQLPSGRKFRVACVHLPTVRFGFRYLREWRFSVVDLFMVWRRGQVEDLTALAMEDSDLPVLLAGDFNTPYVSRLFDPIRPIFREGFDSAGFGYAYTRPARIPWVGIDYVLATYDWRFSTCRVGPDLGSDHRPVLAELVLETSSAP